MYLQLFGQGKELVLTYPAMALTYRRYSIPTPGPTQRHKGRRAKGNDRKVCIAEWWAIHRGDRRQKAVTKIKQTLCIKCIKTGFFKIITLKYHKHNRWYIVYFQKRTRMQGKFFVFLLCQTKNSLYLCTDSFHHASRRKSSEPGWNFCFFWRYETIR